VRRTTGIGDFPARISPEDREKLFTRFFPTEAAMRKAIKEARVFAALEQAESTS
jgi:hypothetical protein